MPYPDVLRALRLQQRPLGPGVPAAQEARTESLHGRSRRPYHLLCELHLGRWSPARWLGVEQLYKLKVVNIIVELLTDHEALSE